MMCTAASMLSSLDWIYVLDWGASDATLPCYMYLTHHTDPAGAKAVLVCSRYSIIYLFICLIAEVGSR